MNIKSKKELKKNYSFYLWADTDKKIGLGHLNRLRFFMQELSKQKIKANFLTKFNSLSRSLIKNNHFFLSNDISYYVKKMILPKEFKKDQKNKIIFIDSYNVNKFFFKLLRENNIKVVYFNDFKTDKGANLNICVGSNSKNKNFLSGFNFIPLASEYAKSKKNLLNKKTVLITLGSADPRHLSLKLTELVSRFDFNILVVVGKYYSNSLYKKLLSVKSKKIKLIFKPKSLLKYFKKSDSVICAGGFTVFESLSLGIPTLCVELCDNQSVNLINLKKLGLIKVIDYRLNANLKLKPSHLDVLFNKKYRHFVSKNALKIISRNGSLNILKETIKKLT
jgi:UDP-2,4-diacetamido-2,4,6-trideoxy-beta-L-altropyranose hydrolase